IIEESGFNFHEGKSKLIRDGQRKLVTGVVVNQKLTIPRDYVRKIKQELYYINKYGVDDHLAYNQIPLSSKKYMKELRGKINYIHMVDKRLGEELKLILNGTR
ncbi:TPA: RNA-directed DNA polymerase, partial [Streptococcus suis]